jgi:hypothetical protein
MSQREVRIVASNPEINISVPMGEGPATIVGGLGGWREVERQDDISATDWGGQEPLKQDVPLMLDGWGRRESVERELRTLFKLGRDAAGGESVPPVFKVYGPIHFDAFTYPKMRWVLGAGGIELSTDEDEVIRGTDGTLYRQGLTLHLMEYVRADQIKLKGRRGRGRKGPATGGTEAPPRTYTTKKDDTLVEIAKRFYGDWTVAKEIGKRNDIGDIHRKLPAGKKLRLP